MQNRGIHFQVNTPLGSKTTQFDVITTRCCCIDVCFIFLVKLSVCAPPRRSTSKRAPSKRSDAWKVVEFNNCIRIDQLEFKKLKFSNHLRDQSPEMLISRPVAPSKFTITSLLILIFCNSHKCSSSQHSNHQFI